MRSRALAGALLLLAACATPPTPAPAPAVQFRAEATPVPTEVMKPEGNGPFPAVVMLHDCSGLGPRSSGAPRRWAAQLVSRGYVVVIPDSFSTRGFPSGVCTDPSPDRLKVGAFPRAVDAYDALDYARTLPYVDGKRVGVMGGSHGGATTLAVLAEYARDSRALAERKRKGFIAAVALYPGCNIGQPRFNREYKAVAPMLILTGELDDWTPAAPCRELVEAAGKGGAPVSIKVYPGAQHAFDSTGPVRYVEARVNSNAPGGRGATTGGNAAAWSDAIVEVTAFLERHLKAPR